MKDEYTDTRKKERGKNSREDLDDAFFDYVLSVASGEQAKYELHGYSEISIFKDGIVL